MMNCAYDETYLQLAQRHLGDMYDYAVNTLKYTLEEFQRYFLCSGMAKQIEIGNPTYVAGKNGCELARAVILWATGEEIEAPDIMYLDKSAEYWIGWSLAYYQWKSAHSFANIEASVPIIEMYKMYPTLHEADISMYVQLMDERYMAFHKDCMLKRLRAYADLSQRQLAEQSGVPLRQIQLFEQGERDIHKTQADTLLKLARALHCKMEDLLD